MSRRWHSPLPLNIVPTQDSQSFREMETGTTGLPLPPHPGGFGVQRKHHTHEGVDLYAPDQTPVHAVEAGIIVKIEWFTGPRANTPWWLDTQAVFVEGESGVVVYGELIVSPELQEGVRVGAGDCLGALSPVLRHDKGRPLTMLHIELHTHGTREAPAWETERPTTLKDPTPFLMAICQGALD